MISHSANEQHATQPPSSSNPAKRRPHGCLIAFIVVVGFVIVAHVIYPNNNNAPASVTSVQATTRSPAARDRSLQRIMDTFGVSQLHATGILNRLYSVGINSVGEFEETLQDGDALRARFIHGLGELTFVITVKDNALLAAHINGRTVYNQQEGAIGHVDDFTLTSRERAEYATSAQILVGIALNNRHGLTYNSTLTFEIQRYKDSAWVTSHVGTPSGDMQFTVEWIYPDMEPTLLVIDGREIKLD